MIVVRPKSFKKSKDEMSTYKMFLNLNVPSQNSNQCSVLVWEWIKLGQQ